VQVAISKGMWAVKLSSDKILQFLGVLANTLTCIVAIKTVVVLFVVMICVSLQDFIAGYSVMHGDARRLIYGYDSFGNICNQEHNSPIENVTLSGRNTSGMS